MKRYSHKINCELNIRGLIIKSKTKANNKKEKKANKQYQQYL